MAAAPGEDALHDRSRDVLGLEDNVIESRVIDERANEGSADPRGIHEAEGCQRAGLSPSREQEMVTYVVRTLGASYRCFSSDARPSWNATALAFVQL